MATTKPKHSRPKAQTPNKQGIIAQVLAGMRSGLSAYKSCKAAGVPHSTFLLWVSQDPVLADNYAQARADLLEAMEQELLEISDMEVDYTTDGKKDWAAVQKHRLQVDTRKWLLSKLAPRKYGDRVSQEITGADGGPLQLTEIKRVIVRDDSDA